VRTHPAVRCALDPSPRAERVLASHVGARRFVYNWGLAWLDVPKPPPLPPHDWLGVDLGIGNLAADSDGQTDSGGYLNGLRQRLQQTGTPSAKGLLKNQRRQEQRLATQEKHRIANQLVTTAPGVGATWPAKN